MSESEEELRTRMGGYIATLLPSHPSIMPIGWPVGVGWTELGPWATLTRGELVLRASQRAREWWMPQTKTRAKEWVERLAYVLVRWHALYADTDETGRKRLQGWESPTGAISWEPREGWKPVTVVLEPGIRPGETNGGIGGLLYQLEPASGRTFEAAREEGWVSVQRLP